MLDTETKIIDTIEQFRRFQDYVSKVNPEYTVLDTETDGLVEKTAKLYGIGLCFNNKYAFYIPWRRKDTSNVWSPSQEKEIADFLFQLCVKTKVIGHNIIYDVLIIENNLGFNITPYVYSDTIMQKHTVDEEQPFGLKEVAVIELGEWANKAQEKLYDNIKANGGRTTKDFVEMYKADTDVLAEYCCWDVALTWRLFQIFEERLKKEGLDKLFYDEEVMPLYKNVTINMKRKGFPINVEYYQNLKKEIETEINKLEDEIIKEIDNHIGPFSQKLLNEECPIKATGNFPKVLAESLSVPLPLNKDGNITLAKKAIEKQKEATPEYDFFYDWMLTGKGDSRWLSKEAMAAAQMKMFLDKHPDQRSVFNLRSNDHLAFLFFNCMGFKPLDHTPGGKPQVDDDFLESVKDKSASVGKIVDFKKLNKLLSTYVEGILERQLDGIIYTSMLQFGTTSGRYSSRDPNLQNQPRTKDEDAGLSALVLKYTNAIKRGFVAPRGYKIVNADYSSLEPVCFAHMSNEERLRDIFRTGKDLYSQVAINVNKLEKEYSADKKAPNFLKKHKPEMRQLWKVPTLGIVYGMGENRLMEAIGCSYNEARKIINGYLNTYPNLRKYMNTCDWEAKRYGFVKTEFGRIRHLKQVQAWYLLYDDRIMDYKWASERGLLKERRKFKNYLNNAKNFKIQGLAAHIVNRSMISIEKAFKDNNIDGYVALQVHDEITCIVREDQAELAAKLLQNAMENTTKISVPLVAEPIVADNWADAK